MRKAVTGCGVLACLLVLSACASSTAQSVAAVPAASPSCATPSGFELSLVSDRGGQSTPIAAAAWFAQHGGVSGIPAAGWRETARNGHGTTVRSGPATLQVVQGPDGTWQVDGGSLCS